MLSNLLSKNPVCACVFCSIRSPQGTTIAASLSDGRVRLLDAVSLSSVGVIPRPADRSFVRDICFAGEIRVVVCYSTGLVIDWLITAANAPRSFIAVPPFKLGRAAPLRVDADDADERGAFSVAVNDEGDVLAVGFEEHIIFYDLRGPCGDAGVAPPVLGCYSSSHNAPVVQLAWHSTVPRHLLSASEDGLVCIFDTGIRGEDDALVAVLNAEGGVSTFGTFGPHKGFVFVLTRTDTLSLWNISTAERIADFGDLKARLQAGGIRVDYFLDCWCNSEGRLYLLTGNHEGQLWVFDITPSGAVLLGALGPATHTSTVRTAVWATLNEAPGVCGGTLCWTAGEDGLLVQWADAAAQAVLPPPKTTPASGSVSGPARRPAALHPLHIIRSGSAVAGASRESHIPSCAISFGKTPARPISPPSSGNTTTDLLSLLG